MSVLWCNWTQVDFLLLWLRSCSYMDLKLWEYSRVCMNESGLRLSLEPYRRGRVSMFQLNESRPQARGRNISPLSQRARQYVLMFLMEETGKLDEICLLCCIYLCPSGRAGTLWELQSLQFIIISPLPEKNLVSMGNPSTFSSLIMHEFLYASLLVKSQLKI